MSADSYHIIREEHLHIELTGTESDGLALQRRLTQICHESLTPSIEKTLDRLSPLEGNVYIDRLEVDAGAVAINHLDQRLVETVCKSLEGVLSKKLQTSQTGSHHKEREPIIPTTKQQAALNALTYFLRFGTLPWSFHIPPGTSFEQILTTHLLEKEGEDVRPHFITSPLVRALVAENARKRLTWQFSTKFRENLLQLILSDAQQEVDRALNKLCQVDISREMSETLKRSLWEAVFKGVSSGKALTEHELTLEVLQTLPEKEKQYLGQSLKQEKDSPPLSTKTRIENPWDEIGPLTPQQQNRRDPPEPQGLGNRRLCKQIPHGSTIDNTGHRLTRLQTQINENEHPDIREGLYIENAGLVILHPFLPHLFEKLNIAAQNQLLKPARALNLLHYLVTGQPTSHEYELVLPKILTNQPLRNPVLPDSSLTEQEKEEAEELLEAVIGHWQVLRNTSTDALRGTFLIRPGKIALRESGDWQLQVETSSFDILMDQLPWGISMIKLPWMTKILSVQWHD